MVSCCTEKTSLILEILDFFYFSFPVFFLLSVFAEFIGEGGW